MMSTDTNRYTAWSVTINNPVEADHEDIAMARQKGWKVIGQLEKGEEGTPHYQLLVKTPQSRFSALKKAFSRAHIEPAKNEVALQRYVTKEETRVAALPDTEKYPSMSKLWMLIFNTLRTGEKDGLDESALPYTMLYDLEADRHWTKEPLCLFDDLIRDLIEAGYHVESLATNPSVRSAWKNYGRAIMMRCFSQNEITLNEHNHATEEDQLCQETHVPQAEVGGPPPVTPDTGADEPRDHLGDPPAGPASR